MLKRSRKVAKKIRPRTFWGLLVCPMIWWLYVAQEDAHPIKFTGGNVSVIDGDTIILDKLKIRLKGIDAPELKQECGVYCASWQCGLVAKDVLEKMISNTEVSCTDEGEDKYRRQLSYCYSGSVNINKAMVKSGFAVTYNKSDIFFIIEELSAMIGNRGIWNGAFDNPKDWRKSQERDK